MTNLDNIHAEKKVINWEALLGTWYLHFQNYIKYYPYFEKLINFINNQYNDKNKIIFPAKNNIFRAFKETNYSNVKVVIIGQDPYADGRANGFCFANSVLEEKYSPPLLKIEDCLKLSYNDGTMFWLDYNLKKWANQGILLLNSALTVEKDKSGSHLIYWDFFTKTLLTILNDNKTGVIFCFWGSAAKKYIPLINEKRHYILECEHPSLAVREARDWKCNHFTEINKILEKNNGTRECINW